MTKKEQLKSILRDKYLAQNPQIALKDLLETQQLIPLVEKFMREMQFITPVVGKDYFTEAEKGVFYSALYEALQGSIHDGAPGKDGENGYTPVKGKDYFDGVDGKTPVRGVDYFTPKDVEMIISKCMSLMPKIEAPQLPDVQAIVKEHVTAATKDVPTGDSVVAQILKHPLLRVLLHGGGSSTGSTTTLNLATEKLTPTASGSDITLDLGTLAHVFSSIYWISKNGQILDPSDPLWGWSRIANTATVLGGATTDIFLVHYSYA